MPGFWPSMRSCLHCALLCAALAAGGAAAQAPDAEARWRALNSEAVGAYRRGAYAEGIAAAERALALARQAFGPRHISTLTSMKNLAILYQSQGRYDKAASVSHEALQVSREALGERHPDTLLSMNNLAVLYESQGRYSEAEPLHREAMRGRREALGEHHPSTLVSMNNLASLQLRQGQYREAEPLLQDVHRLSREALGERHPLTLAGMNNLATLYDSQGRYGEAEPLYREALRLRRESLGPRHPDTLTGLNNLAFLYSSQGQYREAEPLYREALELRREALGPRHPDTLQSMNNLAALFSKQRRYEEAEPRYREALELQREALGPRHPDTLQSMNNLAVLYLSQGRYGDAEPLLRDALRLRREALGPRHPDTLTSMNNLANLYDSQGRHAEAGRLFRGALAGARATLGAAHPTTLTYQLNGAGNLAAQGRVHEAGQQLHAMQSELLAWLGVELYTSEAAGARNRLVASQAGYQHAALSLALLPGAGAAEAEGAASAVLRLKGLQAEEEAFLARLVRREQDPRARELAAEVAGLRTQLAALFHGGAQPDAVAALVRQLEEKELALGRVSRAYEQRRQVRGFDLAALRAQLPPGRALLELRAYQPADFRTGALGPWRWAGLLVSGGGVRVRDLGPAQDTAAQAQALLADPDGAAGREAARSLHDQLLAPFASELAGIGRLHVAPDGALNLVPFAALRGPDRRLLAETLDLRLVQTGRDLLRPGPQGPAEGLLALGGIDFGATAQAAPVRTASATRRAEPLTGGGGADQLNDRTRAALGGFGPLPSTVEEVERVAARYRRMRPGEPVEVWEGALASEARLRALTQPPRVLHLATHGFYRAPTQPQDRPLLLAAVALAGANAALQEAQREGILYAIEAQDLNLEGTELVVLSACETARGQIDYGEGVSGLVRALRTAGARHVMVTLRPVSDRGASEFVQRFYFHWLTQPGGSDPAAALRATQVEAIDAVASGKSAHQTWAQFVLIGG